LICIGKAPVVATNSLYPTNVDAGAREIVHNEARVFFPETSTEGVLFRELVKFLMVIHGHKLPGHDMLADAIFDLEDQTTNGVDILNCDLQVAFQKVACVMYNYAVTSSSALGGFVKYYAFELRKERQAGASDGRGGADDDDEEEREDEEAEVNEDASELSPTKVTGISKLLQTTRSLLTLLKFALVFDVYMDDKECSGKMRLLAGLVDMTELLLEEIGVEPSFANVQAELEKDPMARNIINELKVQVYTPHLKRLHGLLDGNTVIVTLTLVISRLVQVQGKAGSMKNACTKIGEDVMNGPILQLGGESFGGERFEEMGQACYQSCLEGLLGCLGPDAGEELGQFTEMIEGTRSGFQLIIAASGARTVLNSTLDEVVRLRGQVASYAGSDRTGFLQAVESTREILLSAIYVLGSANIR
jgi:hypothetical protein